MIYEIADVPSITHGHATTKHAETIQVLEGTHATMKTSLNLLFGEFRKPWHKYLQIAILNYNTTYHTSNGCNPNRIFQERIPYSILYHKVGLKLSKSLVLTTDFAEELLRRIHLLYNKTEKNRMQSYIEHIKYYDGKTKASPLQEKDD